MLFLVTMICSLQVHVLNIFCIVFTCLYPFYSNSVSVWYILYLIIFIPYVDFSITHSRYNKKIITHILDIVSITLLHIFLSEIHFKLVMELLVLIFLIGRRSAGRWLVHFVVGWVVGGRLVGDWWYVVGSSVVLRKPRRLCHFTHMLNWP